MGINHSATFASCQSGSQPLLVAPGAGQVGPTKPEDSGFVAQVEKRRRKFANLISAPKTKFELEQRIFFFFSFFFLSHSLSLSLTLFLFLPKFESQLESEFSFALNFSILNSQLACPIRSPNKSPS